jgi:hypothetical protein
VTLVYQHELPNVRQEHQGRLVEYGPGGSPGHTHPNHPSSTRPCLKGRSAVRSTTDR